MRNFRILIFIIFIFSCRSSVPHDVLSPKKMQAVLWDVMQADAMAEHYSSSDSTYKRLAKQADYYSKVFAIHKISKEVFTRSLSYYENHPAGLKSILDSLQSFAQRVNRADTLKAPAGPAVADTNLRKKLFKIKPH